MQAGFLQKVLILVRQEVRVHLTNRINGHAHNDQQACAPEVERKGILNLQELGQDTNENQVQGSHNRQTGQKVIEII